MKATATCSRKRQTGILLLLLLSAAAKAQSLNDSLQEVKVKSYRAVSPTEILLQHNTGRIQPFDSTTLDLYKSNSVATLIAEQSPVFIKSYGFNSLSTLSFRGASAAQSTVLWNGVPVNNAALGVADLSLLPVFFSDKISIAYGGSSALLGSGNVGGALLLDSDVPGFVKGYKTGTVSAAAGSFGQKTIAANLQANDTKTGKWQMGMRMLGQQANNDFSFKDETGHWQKMTNSRQAAGHLLVSVARQLKQGSLSLHAWAQKAEREIPPALFEQTSRKQQTDEVLRLTADWRQGSNSLKLAYIKEGINYSDKAIRLYSNAVTHRIFVSETWRTRWDKHQLLLTVPLQLDWMAGRGNSQHSLAAAAFYLYKNQRWQFSVQSRAGWYQEKLAVTPGAGATLQIKKWLSTYLSVQRSFRQPTLNELYYQPGGNAALKPEEGWSGEAGYRLNINKENWQLEQEGTGFIRSIQNWIIWYGGAIWTPHNIASVLSRGAESSTALHWQHQNIKATLQVQTAYVLSTTRKSENPLDGSIGRQLPYVPRYNYRINARVGWQDWLLSGYWNYTGYRFTTSDESAYLEPYDLTGITLTWQTLLFHKKWNFGLSCHNLGQTSYEVVAYRPMPGRMWQLSAGLKFL